MGVVGLYGLFVGGRTWTDQAALKFGGTPADPPSPPKPAVTTVVKKILAAPPKEKNDEVD
jgi:hypothetical protein